MAEQLELHIPKGHLYLGAEKLLILDNVNLKLVRLGFALSSLYLLLLLLNGHEILSWRLLVFASAWLVTMSFVYLLRNKSDAKVIGYGQMQQVKYRKLRFGFTKPLLEIDFLNERQVQKKRYVYVKDEQIAYIAQHLHHKGVKVTL